MRRRRFIAVLLLLATAFFVWGTVAERSRHHEVHAESPSATSPSGGESGETQEGRASEADSTENTESAEFRPLGVNLETNALVVTAAIVSVLLAAAVIFWPRRGVFIAVGLVAAGFTALEIVEVAHQITQHRPGLTTLAALAGLLHAAVAMLCLDYLVSSQETVAV
jgi:hypothetical protein